MEASALWYVYIVECADGTLYTGITNHLSERIATHNTGKGAKYTRVRLPVKLIYSEEHADRSAASKREAAIKSLSRQEKRKLTSS